MPKTLLFNRVRLDNGATVKLRTFRGFVEFKEGDHIARVRVEPVIGKPLVNVWSSLALKWNPPYSQEVIPEAKRQQIIAGVIEGLRWRKCRIAVLP
jgi:hypothetical protein